MYPYLSVAFAFVAVALLVGLSVLGHHLFTANVYAAPLSGKAGFTTVVAGSAVTSGFPVGPSPTGADAKQRAVILEHVRDGADWAKSLHSEVAFWAVALIVLLVVFLGASFLSELWGRPLF
jgi:hypothetical protein